MKNAKKLMQLSAVALTLAASVTMNSTAGTVDPSKAMLTPVGAEWAGNKAGTIPSWQGGLDAQAGGVADDGSLKNPFAADKPLFTITKDNIEQHKDKLTAGLRAMFKRHPDTFSMTIYPTRRSASYPQSVYDETTAHLGKTTLVEDGNGLDGYISGVPFVQPHNGLEVIWNHLTRYRGGSFDRTSSAIMVEANGKYQETVNQDIYHFTSYVKGWEGDDNILFYWKQKTLAPTMRTGEVLMAHETIDQAAEDRKAWVYLPVIRRAKRAPSLRFDTPRPNTHNTKTSDNYDMFNGSPQQYGWELVGKKEIYIPYNNYKLTDKTLKTEDIARKGHLKSDLVRYELHRVWEVKAKLKSGMRNIYSERTMYVDEDTWQIALADHYDSRGDLWRVGMGFEVQYNPVQVPWLAGEALYDLRSGQYVIEGLTATTSKPVEFNHLATLREYTPSEIRRWGERD